MITLTTAGTSPVLNLTTPIRGKRYPAAKLEVETIATPGAAKKYAGLVITPDGVLLAGASNNERRALSLAFKLAEQLDADL